MIRLISLGAVTLSLLLLSIVFPGAWAAEQEQLPPWVKSPPQNDSNTLYGIGGGRSINTAKRFALEDLASRIEVSVSSQTETIQRAGISGSQEEFYSGVVAKVRAISLTGATILETYSNPSTDEKLVLMGLDRRQFVKALNLDLDDLAQSIRQTRTLAGQAKGWNALASCLALADEIEKINPLLSVLSAVSGNFSAKTYKQEIHQAETACGQARANTFIAINAPEPLKSVASDLVNQFAALNLNSRMQEKGDVTIYLSSEDKNFEAFGSYNVGIDMRVKVVDFSGQMRSSTHLKSNGSSILDYHTASIAASKNLVKKINVMELMGFNN